MEKFKWFALSQKIEKKDVDNFMRFLTKIISLTTIILKIIESPSMTQTLELIINAFSGL